MYIKMTIALFNKRLKEGHYSSLSAARRSISRMHDFNEEERETARVSAAAHFTDGGSQTEKFRLAYLKVNEGGKSWNQIAEDIGVHVHTLQRLRNKKALSAASLKALEKGLKQNVEKIKDIPEIKARAKRVARPSLIERAPNAPPGIPSLLELQMRELELNRSLQQYHLGNGTPAHLNGARAR